MRASELRKKFTFSHSKIAISFNILLVLQILCLSNTFIQCTDNNTYIARASTSETYIFRTQIYTINAVSFNYLWYGAMNYSLPTKH